MHFWRIFNEIPSTLQTKPLSNPFISSDYNWDFFNKLSNVAYFGNDYESISSVTTIPTRTQ